MMLMQNSAEMKARANTRFDLSALAFHLYLFLNKLGE